MSETPDDSWWDEDGRACDNCERELTPATALWVEVGGINWKAWTTVCLKGCDD